MINGPAKIIIAIQAKSTSERFPGKLFELIDGKEMLEHVIDSANNSAVYLNKYGSKNNIEVRVVLLIPVNDIIKDKYKNKVIIFEGSEKNVLKRYWNLAKETTCNYIVRLTSDCPLVPSFLISKHITVAVMGQYDYVSNVDENVRTAIDGHDVEVMSYKALMWAYDNTRDDIDREHVTLVLRSDKIPHSFKIAHIIGHIDQHDIKLSVDTREDLEHVILEYNKIKTSVSEAIKKNGPKSVHRI